MLEDLKEIIAIDSVYSDPQPSAPFGKKARAALDWFLEKSASYGFRTGELDGYCGWAEIGEGERLIGVLCHLDVVPAGDGWSTPPFAMTIDGGKIYGRGVADDKGALVACMHALKSVKEEKIKLRSRIRIIVGCNEENGSACMKYYASRGEIPAVSIVPDADFPIINSEKGILHYLVKIPLDGFFKENILRFDGGLKDNVVPDKAEIVIKRGSPLYEYFRSVGKELSGSDGTVGGEILRDFAVVQRLVEGGHSLSDFTVRENEDGLYISARGVAGHAMEPEKGDNAIWKIVCVLSALGEKFPSQVTDALSEYICTPFACEKLGFACSDEQSGDATCSLGVIKFGEESLDLDLNIRLPICCDPDSLPKKILGKLPKGSSLSVLGFSPNLFVDKDSPLVKTLLEVYGKVTGKQSYCVKTGGGTYAKELPHAIAFGPTFPGTVTNLHNADENLPVEEFEMLLPIYRAAMLALDNADDI